MSTDHQYCDALRNRSRLLRRPSARPQECLEPWIALEWLPDRIEPKQGGGIEERIAQRDGQTVNGRLGLSAHHVYFRDESLAAGGAPVCPSISSVELADHTRGFLSLPQRGVSAGEPDVVNDLFRQR